MKHILFIDPIEKLNPKKDSTLMLATTMKQQGLLVYLLFEKDFYVSNKAKNILKTVKPDQTTEGIIKDALKALIN